MPLNLENVQFDDVEEDTTVDDAPDEDTEEPEDVNQDDEPEDPAVDEPEENFDSLEEDLDEAFETEAFEDDEDEVTDEDEEKGSDENDDTEETEEDEVVEEEKTRFVDDLASQFGLDTEEDLDGELEDTWDDALKVARKGAENLASEEINNFFQQYPDLQEYAQYRVNGGEPDKFREEVLNASSYEDMEIEGNDQTQERLVREKLREVDGFDEDRVDDKLERYKSAGVLKSEAEDAKEILSDKQEERKQELIEKQEKEAEQRRKEQLQRQKEYKETIRNADNLGGLQLPENQKDEFEEYLFEPVDEDGLTQAQKDYQEMDENEALSLYYLMFQGGPQNIGDLVDNKASTKKAESLSNKLKKTSNRSVKDKSENNERRKNSGPNLEGFSLDDQIG